LRRRTAGFETEPVRVSNSTGSTFDPPQMTEIQFFGGQPVNGGHPVVTRPNKDS
jgi:hypothetical protein